MYKIKKGSIIQESAYGIVLEAEIISEVKDLGDGRQSFEAMITKFNGKSAAPNSGNVSEFLVGGAYGANITVIKE